MKTLFTKVQDAVVGELIQSFTEDATSWRISNTEIENVKILAQDSSVFGYKENVVFLLEPKGSSGTIGITLGASQIVTHINENPFDNENFNSLKQAFDGVFRAVSKKSSERKLVKRKP